MRRLKALGVKLALDDFGTGYSSLLYLRRFPFDKLKIDKSFVLSIEKTADAAAIVHAVVSLGRGLGMKVTAEGVETAGQHLFLRAAGVHCMQGFRFGKPMPARRNRSAACHAWRLSQHRRRRPRRAGGLRPLRRIDQPSVDLDAHRGDDRTPARQLGFDILLVLRRTGQRLELERSRDQEVLVRLVGEQLQVRR
jgi:hypothetical protein